MLAQLIAFQVTRREYLAAALNLHGAVGATVDRFQQARDFSREHDRQAPEETIRAGDEEADRSLPEIARAGTRGMAGKAIRAGICSVR